MVMGLSTCYGVVVLIFELKVMFCQYSKGHRNRRISSVSPQQIVGSNPRICVTPSVSSIACSELHSCNISVSSDFKTCTYLSPARTLHSLTQSLASAVSPTAFLFNSAVDDCISSTSIHVEKLLTGSSLRNGTNHSNSSFSVGRKQYPIRSSECSVVMLVNESLQFD